MHLAGVVADRDIFARHERMGAKPIAGFVVIFGGIVIIENPLRMFRPARFVQQMPGLFLATPEPAHAAIVAACARAPDRYGRSGRAELQIRSRGGATRMEIPWNARFPNECA